MSHVQEIFMFGICVMSMIMAYHSSKGCETISFCLLEGGIQCPWLVLLVCMFARQGHTFHHFLLSLNFSLIALIVSFLEFINSFNLL